MSQDAAPLRLAHLSDLHLADLSGFGPADLLGKRLTGLANLLTGRLNAHSWRVAELLVEDLLARQPDHVVVTGDLSNLSLGSEFRRSAALLARLGDGRRLSVVPGNHDRYTRSADRRREFERIFAPWLVSDLRGPGLGEEATEPYPWVKLLGSGVALVGLCTARPTPWFIATGELGASQRERLELLLARPELDGRLIVVCLHHPLADRPPQSLYSIRRLTDEQELRRILFGSGAGLVLHGHNHMIQNEILARDPPGLPPLVVLGANSASLARGERAAAARYAVHQLDPRQGGLVRSEWRRWDRPRGAWVEDG